MVGEKRGSRPRRRLRGGGKGVRGGGACGVDDNLEEGVAVCKGGKGAGVERRKRQGATPTLDGSFSCLSSRSSFDGGGRGEVEVGYGVWGRKRGLKGAFKLRENSGWAKEGF